MKQKTIPVLILLALLVSSAFSQSEGSDPNKLEAAKNDISPELKKEAAEFLRNTAVEVNNMRTLENRISFSSELAALMWLHDEKEARAMYQNVINNYRQLLSQYDGQLNSLGVIDPNAENPAHFGNNAANRVLRKYMKAMSVREQITNGLAEHDPNLALSFFNETVEAISNPIIRKQIEESDGYFQARLLTEIAEKDIDTALKYGRQGLSKRLSFETIGLLEKIYEKDAEKGIAFGKDIISKIKSDSPKFENLNILSLLLDAGKVKSGGRIASEKNKPPLFSEQSKRDIAETMGRWLLELEIEDKYDLESFLSNIEKYAPSRASQIRTKAGIRKTKTVAATMIERIPDDEPPPPRPQPVPTPGGKADENWADSKSKLGELSAEERLAALAEYRKTIEGIEDRQQRIMALSSLALQVSEFGDKKLATEILDDARSMINFQPINYRDYLETWMFIGGLVKVEPEKAFPLLENTIYRLNDTISAFVKVGEFIDVEGDMIEEGEVQVGTFGGGFPKQILNGLDGADTTLKSLAIADFKRTKDLTNRFDRQEVRILARMLVLRAILR